MSSNYLITYLYLQHPLHVLLFDALTPLMNCCRVLGDAEGGVRVCRNIINSLEKVVNGPSLELANFYFCLGEMYSERADSSDISPVLAKRYKRLVSDIFGNRAFFFFARQLTQSYDKKVHLEGYIMLKYHSVSMRSLSIIMLVSLYTYAYDGVLRSSIEGRNRTGVHSKSCTVL